MERSPSWPEKSYPHARPLPSPLRPRVCKPPAAISTTPLPAPSPLTAIGDDRLPVVPSPSWPARLSPHANTLPSDFSARVWAPPAALLSTPLRPIALGTERKISAPLPSCPDELSPQVQTVPSCFSATVNWSPTATARSPAIVLMGVGVSCCAVVPSPSWP